MNRQYIIERRLTPDDEWKMDMILPYGTSYETAAALFGRVSHGPLPETEYRMSALARSTLGRKFDAGEERK